MGDIWETLCTGVVVLWGDIWETLPIVCKVPVNKITVGFEVSSSGCGGGEGLIVLDCKCKDVDTVSELLTDGHLL